MHHIAAIEKYIRAAAHLLQPNSEELDMRKK
jgi:hypothetical protein